MVCCQLAFEAGPLAAERVGHCADLCGCYVSLWIWLTDQFGGSPHGFRSIRGVTCLDLADRKLTGCISKKLSKCLLRLIGDLLSPAPMSPLGLVVHASSGLWYVSQPVAEGQGSPELAEHKERDGSLRLVVKPLKLLCPLGLCCSPLPRCTLSAVSPFYCPVY